MPPNGCLVILVVVSNASGLIGLNSQDLTLPERCPTLRRHWGGYFHQTQELAGICFGVEAVWRGCCNGLLIKDQLKVRLAPFSLVPVLFFVLGCSVHSSYTQDTSLDVVKHSIPLSRTRSLTGTMQMARSLSRRCGGDLQLGELR